MTVSGSSFVNNSVTGYGNLGGGAIDNSGGFSFPNKVEGLTVSNSSFFNNRVIGTSSTTDHRW